MFVADCSVGLFDQPSAIISESCDYNSIPVYGWEPLRKECNYQEGKLNYTAAKAYLDYFISIKLLITEFFIMLCFGVSQYMGVSTNPRPCVLYQIFE